MVTQPEREQRQGKTSRRHRHAGSIRPRRANKHTVQQIAPDPTTGKMTCQMR